MSDTTIEVLDSPAGLVAGQLTGFFVGWPNPPSPETHLRLLEQSDYALVAVDSGTNQVVGYITAITDHVLTAYIPQLEVLPEWQGQGIGQALVERMMARLSHLYAIDLLCDDDVVPFYDRLGFRRTGGMIMRHYEHQSGSRE